MKFEETFPDNSPLMDIVAAKLTACFIPDTYHEDQLVYMPITAPVSSCGSEDSSDSTAATVISITGRFRNIRSMYHVDRQVLGIGCQGSVRECVNRDTGKRYAVKTILKGDPAVDPDGLSREIKLMNEMDHHNIIQLVDAFEDDDYLHIITDLCKGGELFDQIVKKTESRDNGAPCFAEYEAARVLHQILAAVSYMHKHGIVHRDLKPENILFENAHADSPIKIIDFGLARKNFGNRGEPPMSTIVGTRYYTAPEVLRRQYCKSCDLWSVGVIAYTLLCGYPPFNGVTKKEVYDSIKRGRYNFPSEEWSVVSPEALDFIRRLLQTNPRKRMTAKEALDHPWIVKHRCRQN